MNDSLACMVFHVHYIFCLSIKSIRCTMLKHPALLISRPLPKSSGIPFLMTCSAGACVITAHRRSLRQGNIFTACIWGHSCPQGRVSGFPVGHASIGVWIVNPEGISASRGSLHPGGSASRGGWTDSPQNTWDTTGYGQQAGGTHPAGMLSCCIFCLLVYQ